MPAPRHDLGHLAKQAQKLACDDPRQVAPELHWRRDDQGWIAGRRARTFTKDRWGVRPDRVVCRPGYTGLYIHGATERGISWLAFLNGDVVPRGESFRRLLEDLCMRVGLPFESNGNGHSAARAGRKPPRVWPFTVNGGRFHRYPGYWVCVLPPRSAKTGKKVVQFRQLVDGTVAPGLDGGRFWRSPRGKRWYHETDDKKPPERAEWRDLPKVPRRHTYRAERVQPTKAAGGVIYFLEGEKDVETAEQCELVADTNPGGAGKLTAEQAKPYQGAAVVVVPDHDTAGIDGARRNAETLAAAGARVKLLEPLGGEAGSGFDFTDWAEEIRREHPDDWKEHLGRELARRAESARQVATSREHEPWSIEIRDFLATELAPRQWIIRHLIQQKDIAMIYAKRGVGKTYAAQAIAWAVVTGGSWLRFEVDRPTGVLYVDGEMPREDLHTRFAILEAGSRQEQIKPLRLLSPDIRDRNLPSLATLEGQRIVEGELAAFPDVGLVIIDAVSTLCNDPHANESDAKSWDSMQSWLLSLRRRGIATLVIHHSGKAATSAVPPNAKT